MFLAPRGRVAEDDVRAAFRSPDSPPRYDQVAAPAAVLWELLCNRDDHRSVGQPGGQVGCGDCLGGGRYPEAGGHASDPGVQPAPVAQGAVTDAGPDQLGQRRRVSQVGNQDHPQGGHPAGAVGPLGAVAKLSAAVRVPLGRVDPLTAHRHLMNLRQ